jgi:hypothetical protein
MKQLSPLSTKIAGATAPANEDDVVEGPVSKREVRAFAWKSFGEIASPYLSPYVHRRGVLDAEYGLRKIGTRFL